MDRKNLVKATFAIGQKVEFYNNEMCKLVKNWKKAVRKTGIALRSTYEMLIVFTFF